MVQPDRSPPPSGHWLALPQVTLAAVDTRSPRLALRALEHSSRHIAFARCLLFTHAASGLAAPAHIEVVDIGPIASAAAYSNWILGSLLAHVHSSHVLLAQWDGFVADPRAWDDAFLDVDYLGAPWGKAPHGFVVGNGGFSLRTRRLLECLQDPDVRAQWHHPEDICIAQTLRPMLQTRFGIRFGSLALAQRFAYENETPPGSTFGFHGLRNLPRALGPQGVAELMPELPDSVLASRDGFKLVRDLVQLGHLELARTLIARRRAAGAGDLRTRWLGWRARRRV